MKNLVIFSVVLFIGLAFARPDEKYTTKYDDINIDDIIKNDRLLKSYVNCLMDRGSCSNEGAELKRIIPDALQTDCSKCSETQKNGSKKLIHHLYDNKREWWNELEAKYDKDGIYIKKYASEFDKSA
ncbi:hypothetical protein Zmor_020627 [Zophobas morio]|uniref:Chemosensory protein n=1 Tax=Zophobas morio TaxID=2755281 RepID=A0AA38I433_9CUCU|nr:hypothetical protein Zmor_020627 [Zophobas morio]